jgi:hypothetical protein
MTDGENMARFRLIWLILIAITLGACSSTGIPRATPTVAPTATPRGGTAIAQEPTRTPIIVMTETHTPAQTATALVTGQPATQTESASITPSPTRTATLTQTATATVTRTPTPTLTPTATVDIASTEQAIQATETAIMEAVQATSNAYIGQTATAEAQSTAQALNRQASQTANAEAIIATESFYTAQTATASANNRASTQTALAEERAFEESLNATSTAIGQSLQATETAFAQQQIDQANAQATISQLVASIPTIPPPETVVFATLAPDQTVEAPFPTVENAPELIGEGEAQDIGQGGEATATFAFPTPPPFNNNNNPNGGTNFTIPQPQVPPPSNFTLTFTTRNFTIGEVVPLGQASVGVTTGYGDAIPRLFARNPANPNQFIQTSHTGALYVNTNGSDYMPNKPFSEYTGQVNTPAENEYFVSAVAWAGNGRYVAFVVDARRGGNTAPTGEDGVHVLDTATGDVRTLVRDCPYDSHPGCQLGGQRDFLGSTSELHWSPDSSRLIVRQQTNERNGALYITPLDQSPNVQPMTLRYEFGTWTRDGQRVVVSGRAPDGNPIIGTINPDNTDLQVILDGNAHGLWIQHAVQRPNGSFVALGRPNGEVAVRIIDQNGNFLTPPIGNAPPQSVTWSSDRSSVTVIAGGVQYIAFVDGRVQTVTVTGDAPPPQPPAEPEQTQPEESFVPPPGQTSNETSGNGIYSVGQQLQIRSEVLNIRAGASINDAPVRDPLQQGEYVRVVGGPVENDGFEWWEVMTADGQQGWIVSMIGVGHTFIPAD